MFKVGLTGGIASGKSTISQHFKNLGIAVYDTDEISHDLMQPGQSAYLESVQYFGSAILNDDLSINRSLLRQKIFNQPEDKLWLEQMIHPMIRQRSIQAMQQKQASDYIILIVPLMFETGFNQLVDYVIAIDCPANLQKSRLLHRDGINEALAQQMISSQMSNSQRIHLSDTSLCNRNDGDRTQDVKSLHIQLKQLAKQHQVSGNSSQDNKLEKNKR